MKSTQAIEDVIKLTKYDWEAWEIEEEVTLTRDDGSRFKAFDVILREKDNTIASITGAKFERMMTKVAVLHPAYKINMITAQYHDGIQSLKIAFVRNL